MRKKQTSERSTAAGATPVISRATLAVTAFFLCAVLVFTGLVRGQEEEASSRRYTFTERRELAWGGEKPLVVRETEGTIYVRGWKKEDISIKAYKTAYAPDISLARKNASLLRVSIESPIEMISVRTVNPTLKSGEVYSYADYSLSVPREIHADLKTGEGSVYAVDMKGAVTARTTSGDITMKKLSGPAVAESESGNILALDCPNLGMAVTGKGDINYSIKEGAPESDLELSTGDGNIDIAFTEGTPLTLDVTAAPGNVDTRDAALTVSTEPVEAPAGDSGVLETRKYYIADGGPTLRISAASGTVTIRTFPNMEMGGPGGPRPPRGDRQ